MRHQVFDNGNLIAALEFRTTEAVFPRFQRELAAFDDLEAQLLEEAVHIGEREYGVKVKFARLAFERLYYQPADAVVLGLRADGQRSHFTAGRTVEMQRATPHQFVVGENESKVANILGDFE